MCATRQVRAPKHDDVLWPYKACGGCEHGPAFRDLDLAT